MKTIVVKVNPEHPEEEVIASASKIIKAGGLVAFPTETVYGLAADAFNIQAVARVFEVKGRPSNNPLPVQIALRSQLDDLVRAQPTAASKLMDAYFPGPLTIVMYASSTVSEQITAGTGKIGIRMPDHPVALALILAAGTPIVAPSANISHKPPPKTADEVLKHLDGKIEMLLDAGDCPLQIPSTVVDVTKHPPRILRHGAISESELMGILEPV